MEEETLNSLKKTGSLKIDAASDALAQLSTDIWEHPELAYKEKHAHAVLTSVLENVGFHVERNYNLETAFKAEYGESKDGPNVAILCEYDALPEIGHACGHNLIAEAGVAAAMGIKAAFDAATKPLGKLTVLGTPAEEDGGGKIDLLNASAFQNIDIAMMVHPTIFTTACTPSLAVKTVFYKFYGKATHAAATPWKGLNALDAAVLAYQNISCLRQQMKPAWRVHVIITKGGTKPNILPDNTEINCEMRAPKMSELSVLQAKLLTCAEAAAMATGCKFECVNGSIAYADMISNRPLVTAFEENAKTLGVRFDPFEKTSETQGSTDMGNVSHVLPSIHPFYSVSDTAINHSKDFTVVAGDSKSQAPTLTQAKAMAFTALDVYTKPALLDDIKRRFTEDFSEH